MNTTLIIFASFLIGLSLAHCSAIKDFVGVMRKDKPMPVFVLAILAWVLVATIAYNYGWL